MEKSNLFGRDLCIGGIKYVCIILSGMDYI